MSDGEAALPVEGLRGARLCPVESEGTQPCSETEGV